MGGESVTTLPPWPLNTARKKWLAPATWEAIKKRRNIKLKELNSYSERLKNKYKDQYKTADKEVKKLARKDKRAYIESIAIQADVAVWKKKQRQLYKLTKLVCGKYRANINIPIKDKDGKLLATVSKEDTRWAGHYNQVLNRPPPEPTREIPEADNDLDIDTSVPTVDKIFTAIKSLKNGKAPGLDHLNAELFKADPAVAASNVHPLFQCIWNNNIIPDDCSKGTIIKIPKKGALNNCNKWRGITLLSIPSKILAKIIVNRMSTTIDKCLREEQADFRKGRGCTDQFFALRNIIEQCIEWQRQY